MPLIVSQRATFEKQMMNSFLRVHQMHLDIVRKRRQRLLADFGDFKIPTQRLKSLQRDKGDEENPLQVQTSLPQ